MTLIETILSKFKDKVLSRTDKEIIDAYVQLEQEGVEVTVQNLQKKISSNYHISLNETLKKGEESFY